MKNKKVSRYIPVLGLIAVLFSSCVGKSESSSELSLLGRTARIIYPEFEAEVSYYKDSTLTWKIRESDDLVRSGTEQVEFRDLGAGIYFLNWLEEDGISVSQVIDIKRNEVKAFITYSDPGSIRGARGTSFVEGKIQFLE